MCIEGKILKAKSYKKIDTLFYVWTFLPQKLCGIQFLGIALSELPFINYLLSLKEPTEKQQTVKSISNFTGSQITFPRIHYFLFYFESEILIFSEQFLFQDFLLIKWYFVPSETYMKV